MGEGMKTCLLITTFNRGNLLNNSLQRLCNVTIPDEVLVVDDGSSDNTQQVCENFTGKLPIRYIYNHSPHHSICSMARNIGVKNTDADVIITAEPEILFVTDVIPQVLKNMETHPDEIISAGVIYHAQQGCSFHPGLITDPVQALKECVVEDYQTQPRSYNQSGYCKTFNMQATFIGAYKRSWLMELGGWDEEFPGNYGFDDIELATRLRINGINQFIDPEMEAIHQWHPHQPPHIQGEMVKKNDEYFASKQLNLVEKEILEQKEKGTYKGTDVRLIANKNHEWGSIKPR